MLNRSGRWGAAENQVLGYNKMDVRNDHVLLEDHLIPTQQ